MWKRLSARLTRICIVMRERDMHRNMSELRQRLIECEKKCGIDHPSHHYGVNVKAAY